MTPAWLFASFVLGLLAMAAITLLILAAVDGFPAGAAGAFTTRPRR